MTLIWTDDITRAEVQTLLFQRFSAAFYRLALRYLSDSMQAEDTVADAFIKIFRAMPNQTFESERGFEAWMRRIVINESLSVLRRRKCLTWVPESAAADVVVEPECLDNLSAAALEACIDKLPDGYRTVFNLYVIDGYKHCEIAKLLNISEGTSKSQLHKARLILQQQLKKMYHGQ